MTRRKSSEQAAAAVNYHPPGPVAKAFMRSDKFVRGIMGPYGSGKSTVLFACACAYDMSGARE